MDYPPRGPRLGGQHTWVLVTRYVIGGGGGGHTVAVPLEKLIALELDQVAQHQVPAMENISTMCPLTVTGAAFIPDLCNMKRLHVERFLQVPGT